MGCGFLEAVYQEYLCKEFRNKNIHYTSQQKLKLCYKGEELEKRYRPDFICYDKIIIELKAVKEIALEHEAQIFNYLKVKGLQLGMLVNFGHYPKAQIKRIIF